MGVKGNGEELIFGGEGKVLKAPTGWKLKARQNIQSLVLAHFCDLQKCRGFHGVFWMVGFERL